jgi:hypothetical protein
MDKGWITRHDCRARGLYRARLRYKQEEKQPQHPIEPKNSRKDMERKSIQHLASAHWLIFAVAAESQPLETVLDVWPRSLASIFFVLRRHRRATAGKPGQRACGHPVSDGSRSRAPCTSESSPASSFVQQDTYRRLVSRFGVSGVWSRPLYHNPQTSRQSIPLA